jgi:hypothetical protein
MSIAVAALTFLAADLLRLERFLAATGLGPNNLRDAAADAGFCASVLDYFLSDEPLLLSFAEAEGLHPEQIARASRLLTAPPARYEP